MRVRWESRLFVFLQERAMDGALEFDEHGRESNSNKAKTGFHNTIAHASGGSFLWVLSLSVQRKYLFPGGNEKPHYDKQKERDSLQ